MTLGNAGLVKQWGEIRVGWGVKRRNMAFQHFFYEKLDCKEQENRDIAKTVYGWFIIISLYCIRKKRFGMFGY